jgi:uncharacterized damage-inducible protein DinB
MDSVLNEAFRYHKWANLYLLDVCAKLPKEELHLTVPGTYGTIAATFQHLASGEEYYLMRLGAGDPTIRESDPFPGLAVLREHLVQSTDRLLDMASLIKGDETFVWKDEHGVFTLAQKLVIVQALHHGNDHRTHICTILGHHGIPFGEMDVWAYADATGAIDELTKA